MFNILQYTKYFIWSLAFHLCTVEQTWNKMNICLSRRSNVISSHFLLATVCLREQGISVLLCFDVSFRCTLAKIRPHGFPKWFVKTVRDFYRLLLHLLQKVTDRLSLSFSQELTLELLQMSIYARNSHQIFKLVNGRSIIRNI